MKMISLAETESKGCSLKIKGRIMLHEEFSTRLQSMCNTLGFQNVEIPESGNLGSSELFSDITVNSSERDAVIVLSCKVNYNPNWGGFCGHPKLLTQTKEGKEELCPDRFLAPYLQQYNSAKKQIYLTETRQGKHLITLPKAFVENGEEKAKSKLIIAINKIAEPDDNGATTPVSTSGSRLSYILSTNFRKTLDAQNYSWKPGKSTPIDQYLGEDMFFFTSDDQAASQNDPLYTTLFPSLCQLVTHRTPHIRAAEIYLRQEFNRTVATLTAEKQAKFPKLLCLAGLDIDMAPFLGHGEKYFVPWKAYMEGVDWNPSGSCSLNQDDLFVRLMQ